MSVCTWGLAAGVMGYLLYIIPEFVQIPTRRPPPGALRAGGEGSFLGVERVF